MDLASPRCEADGCATQPIYGFPGEVKRRCKAHALEAMVRMLAQVHIQLTESESC